MCQRQWAKAGPGALPETAKAREIMLSMWLEEEVRFDMGNPQTNLFTDCEAEVS